MLNGIAPIIIIAFKKKVVVKNETQGIPLLENITSIPLIPVPIYLDEKLTGIYITSETKNLDIHTEVETATDKSKNSVNQKGLGNSITIEALASRNSIGLTILSAMSDKIFQAVTSQEYSITYAHGAITAFNALLEEFSVNQTDENDLLKVTLKLSLAKKSDAREEKTSTAIPKQAAIPTVGG